MSGTLVVGSGVLEELGTQFGRAASGLRDLDVASPLGGVEVAVPGSATSLAAATVALRLGAATQVLGDRADALVDAARGTAASYAAGDARTQARMVAR
ncbi:hypothetical protein [Cellulomonas sp. KRMCY2]|uniref:hypothetical protein n=1 Tax=Cellulomonas sp. KRMCY2 TaxID=1304865 RepID=UPI00045E99C7|nr:hypothetical protein [Cellulomonas sp. KRMCY2]